MAQCIAIGSFQLAFAPAAVRLSSRGTELLSNSLGNGTYLEHPRLIRLHDSLVQLRQGDVKTTNLSGPWACCGPLGRPPKPILLDAALDLLSTRTTVGIGGQRNQHVRALAIRTDDDDQPRPGDHRHERAVPYRVRRRSGSVGVAVPFGPAPVGATMRLPHGADVRLKRGV